MVGRVGSNFGVHSLYVREGSFIGKIAPNPPNHPIIIRLCYENVDGNALTSLDESYIAV